MIEYLEEEAKLFWPEDHKFGNHHDNDHHGEKSTSQRKPTLEHAKTVGDLSRLRSDGLIYKSPLTPIAEKAGKSEHPKDHSKDHSKEHNGGPKDSMKRNSTNSTDAPAK